MNKKKALLALSVAKQVRKNPYVDRLIKDPDFRDSAMQTVKLAKANLGKAGTQAKKDPKSLKNMEKAVKKADFADLWSHKKQLEPARSKKGIATKIVLGAIVSYLVWYFSNDES